MCAENAKLVEHKSSSVKDYFEQYWRYCAALRNWFVAYGIGGCILFISEKGKIFQQLPSKTKATVVIALLAGVVAQIVLAGLNKWIHWCIYYGSEDADFSKSKWHKVSEKLSSCFLIDLIIDLVTFLAFAIATVTMIMALLY